MDNLHPIFDRALARDDKEALFGQRAKVIWLYGLSGSGKSTLAIALEHRLHTERIAVALLDGDNVRTGLNSNLGFSDDDRRENIRRIAEVAKLFLQSGVVTLASFITPRRELRRAARELIGAGDFIDVFVDCPFAVCAERDVKGLYAKAKAGDVPQFTGQDSIFEPPEDGETSLVIHSGDEGPEESLERLYRHVRPRLERADT